MKRKLVLSFLIVISIYTTISILSFILLSQIDRDFIGMGGLLAGFLLLISILPLWKIIYFGGRGMMGVQSHILPPDEHLHQKLHQHVKEENRSKNERKMDDILTISGGIVILISLFML
ncbi:hypothetical protein [Mesobacillus subterraneus]|uniref:DUF3899 domain-containing protein n=1 Tax=Mesobacillus subterraneus TaxID=285983 RepID=A0A3R9FZF5_9BACI|nr:hypothetical protein [Mesobacillus subterraneus]RSD28692.1 hypothetical protein EJA10_03710 [Mesobacillus subterraneus]